MKISRPLYLPEPSLYIHETSRTMYYRVIIHKLSLGCWRVKLLDSLLLFPDVDDALKSQISEPPQSTPNVLKPNSRRHDRPRHAHRIERHQLDLHELRTCVTPILDDDASVGVCRCRAHTDVSALGMREIDYARGKALRDYMSRG